MEAVRRLIPQVDVDMDQLNNEEQEKAQSAAKERRNLEDIFSKKHGGPCSVKIRTLLRVSFGSAAFSRGRGCPCACCFCGALKFEADAIRVVFRRTAQSPLAAVFARLHPYLPVSGITRGWLRISRILRVEL